MSQQEEVFNTEEEETEITEEDLAASIAMIEDNQPLKKLLQVASRHHQNSAPPLSLKRYLQIEAVTGIIIEFPIYQTINNYEINEGKRRTMDRFLERHPWIILNEQKPFTSLIMWLNLYKGYANLNEGQRLVIHQNGELDVVEDEQYFNEEENMKEEEEYQGDFIPQEDFNGNPPLIEE